jgi:hypothetical protein
MSLGERISVEELRRRLLNLSEGQIEQTKQDMEQAAENVNGQSKENCTPGRSPYDNQRFSSKEILADRLGQPYTGAPYTYDNDPDREPPHMRDTITATVIVEDKSVHGIVGTPKEYSKEVHEGTKKMTARPFILDAIHTKSEETIAILGDGVKTHIRRVCRE